MVPSDPVGLPGQELPAARSTRARAMSSTTNAASLWRDVVDLAMFMTSTEVKAIYEMAPFICTILQQMAQMVIARAR